LRRLPRDVRSYAMPPKPAAAAISAEDDAADHEKEFVEKELIISFLKTRLSRCD